MSPERISDCELDGWRMKYKLKERRSKYGRHPGGIVVYYRNELENLVDGSYNEICNDAVILSVETNYRKFGLGFVYNPPVKSPYSSESFYDELEEDILQLNSNGVEDILLLGDWNGRSGEVEDVVREGDMDKYTDVNVLPEDYVTAPDLPLRSNMDKTVNAGGVQLVNLMKDLSLCFLNGRKRGDELGEFTFVGPQGKSTIDYGIVSYSVYYLIESFQVLERCVDSSHFPIAVKLEIPEPLHSVDSTLIEPEEEVEQVKCTYRWINEKVPTFMENVSRIFFGIFFLCNINIRSGRIETAVDSLTSLFQHAARVFKISMQRYGRKLSTAWWNSECEISKCRWRKALKKFRKEHTVESLTEYLERKTEYKKVRKVAIEEQKERKKRSLLSLRDIHDTKSMWQQIKKYTKPSHFVKTSITAEGWRAYFTNVLNFRVIEGQRDEWIIPTDSPSEDEVLDSEITSHEVRMAIRSLKNGKASGSDGILPEMLKATSEMICGILAHLFNKILEIGKYPSNWVQAIVLPLYKGSGSVHDTNNFRGISLLSNVAKCFTRILNSRLICFLDKNKIIRDEQAGFRKGYCTTDNVFILDTLISQRLKRKGNKLYVCFIDFRKAYDSVPRNALLFKLHQIGIRGKFLKLLRSMYSKCTFRVRTPESTLTSEQTSTSGLFQGCTLSPTLFSIYINDIIEFTRYSEQGPIDAPKLRDTTVHALLFADDLVLTSTSVKGLQRLIDRAAQYAGHWGLDVNTTKSKCMIFRRGGRVGSSEQWFLKGSRIEVVKKYKYLGVWFTSGHAWSCHMDTNIDKAKKVVFGIRRLMFGMGDLPLRLIWHIYDTLVAPVILYGAEIYGCYSKDKVDVVDRKFSRSVLGLPNSTPATAIWLEMRDRYVTTFWKARLRSLYYWYKLECSVDRNRLLWKAYMCQRDMVEEGIDCWGMRLKDFLTGTELEGVWEDRKFGDTETFKNRVKRAIDKQAYAETVLEASGKPSLQEFLNIIYQDSKISQSIMNLPKDKRRVMLCARMNVESLVVRKTKNNTIVKECAVCNGQIEHFWKHILWHCPPLAAFRGAMNSGNFTFDSLDPIFAVSENTLMPVADFLFKAERMSKRSARLSSRSQTLSSGL